MYCPVENKETEQFSKEIEEFNEMLKYMKGMKKKPCKNLKKINSISRKLDYDIYEEIEKRITASKNSKERAVNWHEG